MRDTFLADLARRNYSPHTVRSYGSTLSRLSEHASKEAHLCTHADVRSFLGSLDQISNSSRAGHVAAIKSFSLFLRKNQAECAMADIRGLRGPKHIRTLPRPLSEDAAKAVVSLSSRPSKEHKVWEVARNRALILLMYGAGLRSAEALSLPFSVDTNTTLRVLGKGQKERLVPLLPAVSQAVETYRRLYCEVHSTQPERLFEGFSDRALRRLVEGYRKQLGLPDTFTPHALRHSFATHLYQNGADLMVLADLLGHASVSTTAIYTQVDKDSLSKVLSECYGDRYEINPTEQSLEAA